VKHVIVTSLASALKMKHHGKNEGLKANFPEELPLCCAVLIVLLYTLAYMELFKIKRNHSPLFHFLK